MYMLITWLFEKENKKKGHVERQTEIVQYFLKVDLVRMNVIGGGRRVGVPMSKMSSVTIHWLLVYFKVLLSLFMSLILFLGFVLFAKQWL